MNETLDTCGLKCPLPVLKIRKRLSSLVSGVNLIVLADDPIALVDIPHFCSDSGNELLEVTEKETGVYSYTIKKK